MSQNTVNNDIATQIANLKKSILEHDIALNDLIKDNIELEIRITKMEIRQIKKRQRCPKGIPGRHSTPSALTFLHRKII